MGSSGSRGKKVAPARVSETDASSRDDNRVLSLTEDNRVLSLKEDSRSFKLAKTPKFSNFTQSRDRSRHDCHSEGHDSDFSADEDDIDEELDRVLAEYERPRGVFSKRKSSPKKSFIKSKTYGLCNFGRVHNDSDFSSTPHLTRPELCETHPRSAANKDTVPHETTECALKNQELLTRLVGVESLPNADTDSVPGSCLGPSAAMPVMLYDGSEEELMDTIEREFS